MPLTHAQILQVTDACKRGRKQKEVAKRLGLPERQVGKIYHWLWLDDGSYERALQRAKQEEEEEEAIAPVAPIVPVAPVVTEIVPVSLPVATQEAKRARSDSESTWIDEAASPRVVAFEQARGLLFKS